MKGLPEGLMVGLIQGVSTTRRKGSISFQRLTMAALNPYKQGGWWMQHQLLGTDRGVRASRETCSKSKSVIVKYTLYSRTTPCFPEIHHVTSRDIDVLQECLILVLNRALQPGIRS